VLKKMRLSQTLHFFNLLEASYNNWKPDLVSAFPTLQNKPNMLTYLWKLYLLFEYFIPVVCVIFFLILHFKVQLYGSTIRKNDLGHIIHMQTHLVLVYHLLRGSNVQMVQYCRCLLWNITILIHLIQNKHPIGEFLSSNADFLNEEDGEVLLSYHSQHSVKITDKGNVDLANSKFQYLGTRIGRNDCDYKKRKHSHVRVDNNEKKVKKLGMIHII
jgi:hypothetical protein